MVNTILDGLYSIYQEDTIKHPLISILLGISVIVYLAIALACMVAFIKWSLTPLGNLPETLRALLLASLTPTYLYNVGYKHQKETEC